MKKQVLILCLCFFGGIGTVSAQLKVTSDGKIAIQTTGTPVCPIAINGTGDSNYHMAITGEKGGIRCIATGENTTNTMYGGYFSTALSTSHTSVGLRAVAGNSSAALTTHSCFGVMAIAAGGRRNIGVLGKIDGTGGGAGVYGSIGGLDYGTPLFADQNRYAGYFNGDTKVTGNLIVDGTIEGVLLGESLSSSPNIASYEEIGADRRSIVVCLSPITVGKY